jgi:hypothetical protein
MQSFLLLENKKLLCAPMPLSNTVRNLKSFLLTVGKTKAVSIPCRYKLPEDSSYGGETKASDSLLLSISLSVHSFRYSVVLQMQMQMQLLMQT